jgi:hypothetical protein
LFDTHTHTHSCTRTFTSQLSLPAPPNHRTVPPILFPSTIFSGTLYDLNTAHGARKFLAYISLIRYAVGGMTVNEYQPDPSRYAADPQIPNPEAAWKRVAAYPLATDLWALLGFAVAIRFAAYLLLLRRTSRERVKVV